MSLYIPEVTFDLGASADKARFGLAVLFDESMICTWSQTHRLVHSPSPMGPLAISLGWLRAVAHREAAICRFFSLLDSLFLIS